MLNISELVKTCDNFGFTDDAVNFFSGTYKNILCSNECIKEFQSAFNAIIACNNDFSIVEPYLNKVSHFTGIDRRGIDMLFRLVTIDDVYKIYTESGVSGDIADDTISANIIAELEENRRVYGDWGTFVLWFHTRTYERKLFKLGRLQFETTDNPEELYCHIISFLPFNMELIMDSLNKAYEFFGFNNSGKRMKIIMESWILHPSFEKIFSDKSNLKEFRKMFKLTEYHDTNSELWYIFWNQENTPLSDFPSETSLQRKCLDWLNSGKQLGEGSGYFYYDGSRISY